MSLVQFLSDGVNNGSGYIVRLTFNLVHIKYHFILLRFCHNQCLNSWVMAQMCKWGHSWSQSDQFTDWPLCQIWLKLLKILYLRYHVLENGMVGQMNENLRNTTPPKKHPVRCRVTKLNQSEHNSQPAAREPHAALLRLVEALLSPTYKKIKI